MYTHCIVCQTALGANTVVEHFPVGRRLAFDADTGRLWAVCRRCERWNLTPLEERWEAIEECERLYRDARRRVSTDNIGLARLDEGLELVRIGRPQRPEFAAWRYGDQFGRRRRRAFVHGGAIAAGAAALAVGGPLIGVAAGTAFTVLNLAANAAAVALAKHNVVRLPHPEVGQLHLTATQLQELRLVARPGASWALEVPYAGHSRPTDTRWRRFRTASNNMSIGRVVVEGPAAERVAATVLPRINGLGAPQRPVREAVALIEEIGDPGRVFAATAARTREYGARQLWGDTGAIRFLPQPVRLALEMAAHEDAERRALAGELAELEAAWRAADEIAAIADDLLLPPAVTRTLHRLKHRGGA